MRVLFVGDMSPWGRSYQRCRALADLGHTVVAYPSVPVTRPMGGKCSVLDRGLWKLGLPRDLTAANAKILVEVRNSQPEVIWLEKGNTIWPGTLRAAKSASPGVRLVSFSEDDMFVRHNRSIFYARGLKYYDMVFTTKSYNCGSGELPALGARCVVFVDKAYDVHAHQPVALRPGDERAFGGDVGFVGSFERLRAEAMLFLARNGVRIRIWGCGWARWRGRDSNLVVEGRPVYGDDYARTLCATKINLCFLRKMNRDLQTDRTMEIPACEAFMLGERTDEHLRLFEEGKEAEYFASNEELLAKVRYYLHHERERRAIAEAGRRRCVESGYSHHERLKQMLLLVWGGPK